VSRLALGVIAVLLLWGAIAFLRDRAAGGRAMRQEPWRRSLRRNDDAIDQAALEDAEREVRDLPADARGADPDDDIGTDWGPGTARNPWGHG